MRFPLPQYSVPGAVQKETDRRENCFRSSFMNETGILTGFSGERTAARGLISRIILPETFVVHTGTEIVSDQHMVRDNAADRITGQLKFIAILFEKKG